MLCPPHAQIRELGHGAYGTAVLMRNRETGEMVAVKFIERGAQARGLAGGCRHTLRRLQELPAACSGSRTQLWCVLCQVLAAFTAQASPARQIAATAAATVRVRLPPTVLRGNAAESPCRQCPTPLPQA